MPLAGEPLQLEFRPVGEDAARHSFCCGARELDSWFARSSVRDQARGSILATCAFVPTVAVPVGFFAIASVAEEARKLPGFHYHLFGSGKYFPCLQLVYVAVHRTWQRKGIGSALVGAAITTFAEVAPRIGLPHLILVPIDDDIKSFYEELGFVSYDDGARMFLPIQSALQAVEEMKALQPKS